MTESNSSQTDENITPHSRSGGFFNFNADQTFNESIISPLSPRKHPRKTTVTSVDQSTQSPPKTTKTKNVEKKSSTPNPFTEVRQKLTDHLKDMNDGVGDTNEMSSSTMPKRALPACLAESFRAVFAAFLWHEGLVHDAMACSSFLKFHPSLPKNNALTFAKEEFKEDEVNLSR